MIFRKALAAEAPLILALYRSATEKGKGDGSSNWDDEYPSAGMLQEDLLKGRLFVLEEEGQIVAAITMEDGEEAETGALPWTMARSCLLMRLCVSPLRQGQGLGERMMRLISEEAKVRGFEASRHLAATENLAANRLYKRMGYSRLGTCTLFGTEFVAYERIL